MTLEIITSNFARQKRVEADGWTAVGIAISPPRWFKGTSILSLAPTKAMLKMSKEDYDKRFWEILSKTTPEQILKELEDLGGKVALLCWESPNIRCHRRCVAEWLEPAIGQLITEHTLLREEVLSYAEAPRKGEPKPKLSPKNKKKGPQQP